MIEIISVIIGKDSKRSILESFKEELKRTQKERDERHTQKSSDQPPAINAPNLPNVLDPNTELEATKEFLFDLEDSGDPISTNLYVGKYHLLIRSGVLLPTFGILDSLFCVFETFVYTSRLTFANLATFKAILTKR